MARPGEEGRLELGRVEDRAVDAQADVSVARRRHAAEAGSEPAGHAGLERQLGRNVTLGADGANRLEHRRRAAGVDGGLPPIAAVEPLAEELRDERLAPGGSVVRRYGGRGAEQRGRLRVRARPEAEQDLGAAPELVAEAEDRRDSDAASDEHVPPAGAVRRPEPDSKRAGQPEAVALSQLRQPPRARSDRLEQELEEAAPVRACVREGARQVRTLVLAAPALGRGEHVELPRLRIARPAGIARRQQAVRAEPVIRLDAGEPAAEGRLRARIAHLSALWAGARAARSAA